MTPTTQTTKLSDVLANFPGDFGKVYTPDLHASAVHPISCARYFMYRVRLGWNLPEWKGALETGDIFHTVMEKTYAGLAVETAVRLVAQEAELKLHELTIAAEEAGRTLDLAKIRKDLSLGIMLGQVFSETFPLQPEWVVLAVERRFRMSLYPYRLNLWLSGKVDAVVDHGKTGIWIHDHKSTGSSAADRQTCLPFEAQPLLYRVLWDAYAAEGEGREPSTLKRASGVVHNIIEKPTIRQKKNQTLDEFVAECYEKYDGRAIAKPHQPPMIRSHIAFNRPPLRDDQELLGLIKSLELYYTKPPSLHGFPRCGSPHSGCVSRGRVCKFHTLCREENPKLWAGILERGSFTKTPPDDEAPSDSDTEGDK